MLGIDSLYLGLRLDFSDPPTDSCCAGNTTSHHRRARWPELGQLRAYGRAGAGLQDLTEL
jgi:hypothetical protein